jgi:putative transcriptional regulator
MDNSSMNFLVPPKGNLEGKLLVSTPSLNGSIFEKCLIFICAHDSEGTVGAVINKNIGLITSEELVRLLDIKRRSKLIKRYHINYGGPVEETKLFILSATKEQKAMFKTDPKLTLYTNAEGFLGDVIKGKQKDDFILVKGFCGWGPNQLEEEIKENSWMLVEPDYKTIFAKNSSASWDKTIKSLGIKKFDTMVSYSGSA